MKRLAKWILFVGILISLGLAVPSQALTTPANRVDSEAVEPGPQPGFDTGAGMPGWPLPDQPIPHHEPGQPARVGFANYQFTQLNALGELETIELTGLDALLADGTLSDPLQGNYRLVDLDKIMFSSYALNDTNTFTTQSFEYITSTLATIPGSTINYGNIRFSAIAAGDLNGDFVDEQIAAWVDPLTNHINIKIGELPGFLGKATSAPAVIAGAAGLNGWALGFDGVDDYVGTGPGINLANSSFTVAFWARRNSAGTDDFAIGHGAGGTNLGLHLGFLGSNDRFRCSFHSNDLDTPEAYTDNAWHHWACTYDVNTNLRTIYRDGIQVAQDTSTADYQGAGELEIGRYLAAFRSFDGLIDDVGIWSVAHTPGQIQADMLQETPDETSLAAYWHFDEESGTITADASGSGNDGTLYGPQWHAYERLLLLVRGYDQALWHCTYDVASGDCLFWSNAAGGTLLSGPAAVSRTDGETDVFAIGLDNQVYHQHLGTGWGGWNLVDGQGHFPSIEVSPPMPVVSPPAAVARGGSQLDLFRRGPDNTLWWCTSSDGLTWDAWQNLGGMLSADPGAISLGEGRMQVYALGFDGALWYRTYDTSWGAWQRLETPEGVSGDAFPVLTSPGTDQVVVYLAGTENRIWSIRHDGSAWGGWSSITMEGGNLGFGLGAATTQGDTHLFAQMVDGSITHINGSEWENLPGPNTPIYFDTGIETAPLPTNDAVENSIFDLATGYFSGDGRQQVILAYDGTGGGLRLEVYDIHDGFRLAKIAEWMPDIPYAEFPRVAAGDVDGDGVDEIGFVHVHEPDPDPWQGLVLRIYRIEKDAKGDWTGDLIQVSGDIEFRIDDGGDIWNGYPFGGTLRIEAGDIVPESNSNNDEFAIVSDWRHDAYGEWRQIRVDLHLYDYPAGEIQHEAFTKEAGDDSYWSHNYATGVGLAVGDVDGDGIDDVIFTRPRGWDGGDYPDLERDLVVYGWQGVDVSEKASYVIPEFSRWSFLDVLAAGDLDQDLKQEIVMAFHAGYNNYNAYYYLDVYEFESLSSGPTDRYTLPYGNVPRAFGLALGDFTGQGVKVGTPSFRVQTRVDSVLARLNMPPKHWDMIQNPDGSYDTIQILTEECWTSPYDPKCTHTLHGTIEGDQSSTSIETQRDWAIAAGAEWKFSNGLLLEGSLEASYGQNFSQAITEIQAINFTADTTAAYDDAIIYYGNPYRIWEYPVFSDNTGEPGRYITVIFPDITHSSTADARAGGVCQEGWYSPGHQPYNVWSYDPIGPVRFADYDPENLLLESTYEGTESEFKVYFEELTGIETSSSQFHGINSDFGIGFEASGSAGINLGIFSVSANFENRFKAYVKAEYNWKEHVTDKTQASQATYFSAYLASTDIADHFTIRPFAYWATAGPLVIDFQTGPGTGTTWQRYDQPDPAFILPWYGYPDPQNLPFPDPNNQGAPPCGPQKQTFSHDVSIDPPLADVGETVVISATVRNFSNIPVDQTLTVIFYQGLPGPTNAIGECTIAPFARSDGAQNCAINWSATGTGEQKIYAIIDPDDQLVEMHDENHIINNNLAYGLIQIGAASYFDMGVAEPYTAISYTQSETMSITLYVPSANLDATTRLDLHHLDVENAMIGHPFEVVAAQGSDDREWGTPISNFPLRSEVGDPPAVIVIGYAGADLTGFREDLLTLYRKTGLGWQPANLDCGTDGLGAAIYPILRFPQDDLIAIPICQTGTFALADENLQPWSEIYLPLISR